MTTGQDARGAALDFDKLLKYAAGDRSVALEVLQLFAAQSPEWLASLRAAETLKDFTDTAHAVKGAARGIGAEALADAAAEAEAATELALQDRLLGEIESAIQTTLAAIRALEAEPGA